MGPPPNFMPKGGKSTQAKKGTVWTEANVEGLVQQFESLDEEEWFQTSLGRSHCVL
jgi:hypothetical protein